MLRAMLRDTVVYTLPTALAQGLGLVLVPIYARVLTREEFGVLDLVLALTPVVAIVMSLEILQGMARLRADADEEDRRRMTGTAWTAVGVGLLVFLLVGLSAAGPVGLLVFGRPDAADVVRLGVMSITATALSTAVLGQFRWELRSRTYAAVSALYALLTVGLVVVLTVVGGLGLNGVLLAQTAAGAAATALGLVLLRGSWRPALDIGQLRRMLAFSLPLIPASLSILVTLYFNRFAIAAFGDLDDVAGYGMAARLAGVVGLLVIGMQSAVTPLVYQHYREEGTPRDLAHLFSGAVGLCVLICLGLNLFAADVTVVVAGQEYLSSAALVALIAPALLLGQLYVFAPGMGIALKTRSQLTVAAVAALVDIVVNLALVPWLGALGGAIATLVSAGVFLLLWVRISQRHYPVPFERGRLAWGLGLFVVGSVVAALARTAFTPLDPGGVAVKVALGLAFAVLLWRTGLFHGLRAALVARPTSTGEDPTARSTG